MNQLNNTLDDANVFLTGATGLIGGEMLRRLLQTAAARIFCLVRRPSGISPKELLFTRLGLDGTGRAYSARIRTVVGDVTRTDLGLSPDLVNLLRTHVTVVVHCAGETSFLRHRECQDVNITGLTNLLRLVATFRRPVLFVYVGSAAACGDRRDTCLVEEDYPHPQDRHFIRYTKSKAFAENLLRRQHLISDWLILRPSIVLPDNVPNSYLARRVLWALVLMNEIRYLPLNYHSNIDAVPLSFVGECAIRLIEKPDRQHRCYHISAGRKAAVTWGDVVATMKEALGRDRELVCLNGNEWIIVRDELTRRERKLQRRVSSYFPFINQNVLFDNQRLYAECTNPSPSLEHFRSYLPRLLQMISLQEALLESEDP